MDDFLKVLVNEDSAGAWSKVRSEMPWSWTPSEQERKMYHEFELEQLDTDPSSRAEVQKLLEESEGGTIFGEFYVSPVLAINEGYVVQITRCEEILNLQQGSTPSLSDLSVLYRSKSPLKSTGFSTISYMSVICPRCHLLFTGGDLDIEVDHPDNCVQDDCFACDGTGEWEFEL